MHRLEDLREEAQTNLEVDGGEIVQQLVHMGEDTSKGGQPVVGSATSPTAEQGGDKAAGEAFSPSSLEGKYDTIGASTA